MSSDARRVYLRHRYHPRAPILAVPCDEGRDTAIVIRKTQVAPVEEESRAVGAGAVFTLHYPSTLYTGFAVGQGVLFESETTTDRNPDGSLESTTTFSVTDTEGRRSARVDRDWRILDGKDGELLIYTPDPDPRLVVLPMEAVGGAVAGG